MRKKNNEPETKSIKLPKKVGDIKTYRNVFGESAYRFKPDIQKNKVINEPLYTKSEVVKILSKFEKYEKENIIPLLPIDVNYGLQWNYLLSSEVFLSQTDFFKEEDNEK